MRNCLHVNPCEEVHPGELGPGELRPDWDNYFLGVAHWVSKRADCTRRQVGCVLVSAGRRVISTGYNGAPAGDPGCLDGHCPRGRLDYDQHPGLTENYDNCIAIHAEANALLYAVESARGATAYITDPPCPSCLKLLRGAGIERIVTK